MKANLYRNIDLVRIPIKTGVKEYQFPRNVDWADKVVDKIVFCPMAPNADTNHPSLDPVDGTTPIISDLSATQRNAFVNLTDEHDVEIMHYLHLSTIRYQNIQSILEVNARLNLSLCSIKMTDAPVTDGTMLLYVFWGGKKEESYDYPCNSITADFELAAHQEMTFREIINTYIHAMPQRVRGVIAERGKDSPAYLTLRDHQYSYVIRNVHTQLFEPARTATFYTKMYPYLPTMLFDNIDIDFDYSRIRNAQDIPNRQILTFLY